MLEKMAISLTRSNTEPSMVFSTIRPAISSGMMMVSRPCVCDAPMLENRWFCAPSPA